MPSRRFIAILCGLPFAVVLASFPFAVLMIAIEYYIWKYSENDENDENQMQRVMMRDMGLYGRGAVCLDGTDAGFSIQSIEGSRNWLLYLGSGGWCFDEEDCLQRAQTDLGSSANWSADTLYGGILSRDCEVSPDFCNFNFVTVSYCDGASFVGDREEPLLVNGRKLYFRGKRIINAVIDTLLTMGMDQAEHIVLSGASAGGLATILNADAVGAKLSSTVPSLMSFRAISLSGFFLLHDNVNKEPLHPKKIKQVFAMANAKHSLDSKCIASYSEREQWRCMFAQAALDHVVTPIFLIDSAADSFQIPHILLGSPSLQAAWEDCTKSSLTDCHQEQIDDINSFITSFYDTMKNSSFFAKPGNGVFIHSCFTHCAAVSNDEWLSLSTPRHDGQQESMSTAVSEWWTHGHTKPGANEAIRPCLYHADQPHTCNDTCPQSSDQGKWVYWKQAVMCACSLIPGSISLFLCFRCFRFCRRHRRRTSDDAAGVGAES